MSNKVAKLLYIPSGECIMFVSSDECLLGSGESDTTSNYYDSQWYSIWKDSLDTVIRDLCTIGHENDTKIRHKMPIDIQLDETEFEIIYY